MSTGSLSQFKRSKKPVLAGDATNCLSCAAEPECQYSARQIYRGRLLRGDTGFPVAVVLPDIEELMREGGVEAAEEKLMERLADDYGRRRADGDVRPRYGRCVYEAGNDVCDDQFVTLTWDEDEQDQGRRGAKSASLHMVAFTAAVCERRSRIYGARGEMEADSKTIKVHDFGTGQTQTHRPQQAGGGHGGGDDGLAAQFVAAIEAVKNQGMSVAEAQTLYLGCTLEDIVRSHAVVFAAEDARRQKRVIDWPQWWQQEVESRLGPELTLK